MNYVISLKRTPKRLERFLDINKHMSFEVFDAIDGNDLEPIGNFNQFAHGVALSHVELWKKCAEGTEDFLICEDDAELHKDLPRALDSLKDGHPYDFIGWGWNTDGELFVSPFPTLTPISMMFSQSHMLKNKNVYLNTPIDPIYMQVHYYFGSCCYTITPEGARQFLEILYPFQENVTIDIPGIQKWVIHSEGIDCSMAAAFAKTNSVVCFPPMALTENDKSTSTVQIKI